MKYGPRSPPDSVAVYLALHYPNAAMDAMVAHLGAPAWKVRRWAQFLGIRRRRTASKPGMESVAHSAARSGLYPRTLRRILKWHGVRLMPTHRSGEWLVRKSDVDRAVAAWVASETIESGARSRGIHPNTLRNWLRRAGLMPRRKCGSRTKRVATATIDAIVKANSLDIA